MLTSFNLYVYKSYTSVPAINNLLFVRLGPSSYQFSMNHVKPFFSEDARSIFPLLFAKLSKSFKSFIPACGYVTVPLFHLQRNNKKLKRKSNSILIIFNATSGHKDLENF